MAIQQLYSKPKPKLPAYASSATRSFRPLDEIEAPTSMNGTVKPLFQNVMTNKAQMAAAGDDPARYNEVKLDRSLPTNVTTQQSAGGSFVNGLKNVAPFATNIANMFTKPPLPPAPSYMTPVNLQRANLDSDRAVANQQLRGMDIANDRRLDGNNAVVARTAGYTQRVKALTDINGRERNENTNISNRETQINTGIQERNLGANDQYNRDLVERSVAMQSQRSANLADASDKFVAGQNQDALKQLDKDKLKVLSKMSPDVWKRFMSKLKADGYDPEK